MPNGLSSYELPPPVDVGAVRRDVRTTLADLQERIAGFQAPGMPGPTDREAYLSDKFKELVGRISTNKRLTARGLEGYVHLAGQIGQQITGEQHARQTQYASGLQAALGQAGLWTPAAHAAISGTVEPEKLASMERERAGLEAYRRGELGLGRERAGLEAVKMTGEQSWRERQMAMQEKTLSTRSELARLARQERRRTAQMGLLGHYIGSYGQMYTKLRGSERAEALESLKGEYTSRLGEMTRSWDQPEAMGPETYEDYLGGNY